MRLGRENPVGFLALVVAVIALSVALGLIPPEQRATWAFIISILLGILALVTFICKRVF